MCNGNHSVGRHVAAGFALPGSLDIPIRDASSGTAAAKARQGRGSVYFGIVACGMDDQDKLITLSKESYVKAGWKHL